MTEKRNPGAVQLLDCTLGSGGLLISNRFGENEIRSMQSMLLKTKLDIIEYGVLCSYQIGVRCSVYDTTQLPINIIRQKNQLYSVLLDPYSRPLLKNIPERTAKTADIIRMNFSSTKIQEDIAYYSGLRKKGYSVAILVSEIAQYTQEELEAILEEINALHPWGCYICDQSGSLTLRELEGILALFSQKLSEDIGIGFQGRDNLHILSGLTNLFTNYKTDHPLWLDVSLNGFAESSLQPASEKVAKKMNAEMGTDYAVTTLEYLASQLEHYVSAEKKSGTKLLYYSTAEAKCSTKYADYYCSIPIDLSDQLDLYANISREAAYKFKRKEANKALLQVRKNKLNLGVFVFTKDHPDRILDLLESSYRKLLEYGVDIIVCDESKDTRTEAAAANYQIEDNIHVKYKKISSRNDTDFEKLAAVETEDYLAYDYVWPMRDELIPTIEGFYFTLLDFLVDKPEWIVVDPSFHNNGGRSAKHYKNCQDFFADNCMRLPILGSGIFRSTYLCDVISKNNGEMAQTNPFAFMAMALEEAAAQDVKTALIVDNTYYYKDNSLPKNIFGPDTLKVWGTHWYQTISALPEAYDAGKPRAFRFHLDKYYPFQLRALLSLRSCGGYTLSDYHQNRHMLHVLAETASWKYILVGAMPKAVAGMFYREISVESSGGKIPKVMTLINKIYRKLGRV